MEYALIPPKQDSFVWLAVKHEQNAVEANLPLWGTYIRYFAVYGTNQQFDGETE